MYVSTSACVYSVFPCAGSAVVLLPENLTVADLIIVPIYSLTGQLEAHPLCYIRGEHLLKCKNKIFSYLVTMVLLYLQKVDAFLTHLH